MNEQSHPEGFDPLNLLRYATKTVPATRWAVGVVGVAAAAAIVVALGRSPLFAVVAVSGMFVAMVALFVFSRILTVAAAATRPVAVALMWFMVVAFMATVLAVFTSSFFNAPWPLRDRLFASAVAANAESAGLPAVASAAKDVSDSALKKLVDLNDAFHNVGYFEPDSNTFVMAPVPPEIAELDAKGLIVWSMPGEAFERVASKYRLQVRYGGGGEPQKASVDDGQDRQTLRQYSYRLNDRGQSLYRLIIDTVVRQISKG